MLTIFLMAGCGLRAKLKRSTGADTFKLLETHRERVDKFVPIGTSIQEAASVYPRAHNTDTNKVWIWTRSASSNASTWKAISESSSCFFVVIVDGRTATPLCGNAALSPAGALVIFQGWSQEKAEAYVAGN